MEEDEINIQEEDVVYGVIVTELVLKLLRKVARDVKYTNEHVLDIEDQLTEIKDFMTKFQVYQQNVDATNRAVLEAISAQGIVIKGLLDSALNGDIPGIDQNIADLNASRTQILEAIQGLVSDVPSPTEPLPVPPATPENPVPPLELPEPVREVPTTVPDVIAEPSPEGVGVEGGLNVG
jgi:hypothetical protein